MAANNEVILTVLGGVVLALIGYFLNGWRERAFERKRCNYGFKLRLFEEMMDAANELERLDNILRQIHQLLKDIHSQKFSFIVYAYAAVESSCSTKFIGKHMDVGQLAERWFKDHDSLNDDERSRLVKGIHMIYWDAVYDARRDLSKCAEKVTLVAETTEVLIGSEKVADDLSDHHAAVDQWFVNSDSGNDIGKPALLKIRLAELIVAMKYELEITMRSWYGQRVAKKKYLRSIAKASEMVGERVLDSKKT